VQLRRKLRHDWRSGPSLKILSVPSSATHAVVFDDDRRLAVSVDNKVIVFNLSSKVS